MKAQLCDANGKLLGITVDLDHMSRDDVISIQYRNNVGTPTFADFHIKRIKFVMVASTNSIDEVGLYTGNNQKPHLSPTIASKVILDVDASSPMVQHVFKNMVM